MSAITRFINGIVRPHLPLRTVRLRLTLVYGGLFLISGVALLAITYLLVRHRVNGQADGFCFVPIPGSDSGPAGNCPTPPTLAPPGQPGGPSAMGESLSTQMAEAVERQRATVMRQLLIQSGLALALMSVLSIGLGWLVAGRILRPLRTITTAVREISATSLHRRLAIDGPADELTELGDTFDSLLSRLEAAFQAQRQFVANASHELRTPLARQRTLGQVALADPDATVASLRSAIARILVAGAEQDRLVGALLTLTRGQAGIEVRHLFDLAQLTRDVIDGRTAEANHRTVTIRSSISPVRAAGHQPLAERLVANLVENAIRHNRPDGWVEVTTRAVDDNAVLTITNTGPVVPADAIDRLFQPFHGLGTARTSRGGGLGLGLSIVQAIAAAHSATVMTTARPEGGLVVTVTFPATSSEAAVAAHSPWTPRRRRTGPTGTAMSR